MMQYENSEPSWPFFNDMIMSSNFDQTELSEFIHRPMDGSEFLSSLTDTESSPVSSETFSFTVGEITQFPVDEGIIFPENEFEFHLGLEEIENIWSDEMESFLEESNNASSISEQSAWSPSQSLECREDMEVDTILHLVRAYGGAIEEDQRELQCVILKCLREKVSPVGGSLERLAFRLTQEAEEEEDYLRRESCKNYEAALEAFYLIFPYGRFAHMSANSAIVEAVPEDEKTVHIVDFDLGDGFQWPSVMEAIARQQKALKLTCIKPEEEEEKGRGCFYRFEDTKRRLSSYARSLGLKLKVEETKIGDLVSEMKKSKKRGGRKEWVGFNCMVGLPHIGKGRSRKLAMEFQCLAKELMANSTNGILTVGDGDACHGLSFGSYFEGCLVHYKALLESMEMSFPEHLGEARVAMESLFVAPQISAQDWKQKWEQVSLGGLGMEGWRVSAENLMQAREMVRQGESMYGVRIGVGEKGNEMILEWRGTPLVRMSAWRM